MTELQYCTRCLYPATKPRLEFDEEGVCSACRAFERRAEIDWTAREREWDALLQSAKNPRPGQPYDCVVPVSGGKDSTCQVVTALQYGLRPLAVTAMTDHLTDVGRANLDNISKLGVDHVMVQTDQKLRRRLNKFCLDQVGDISWAEHVTIFTVPIREALIRGIPLILYGENPENEYGGPFDAQGAHEMTRSWLEEFGGLCGLRVSDIVDFGIATEDDMFQYRYPEIPDGASLQAVFLGYYFPWDSAANVGTAAKHGFYGWGTPSGSWLAGENIDNEQTGLHDFFMYLKFGYGRATAQLSQEIRRGRIERARAVKLVRELDGEYPWRYVDAHLHHVLERIELSRDDLWLIIEKFANRDLFDLDRESETVKPKFTVR